MATHLKVQQIEQALKLAKGKVYLAAKALGCSPSSIYRKFEQHPHLREIVENARGELLDIAETSLMRAVLEGEAWAVCFTLKTLGKERGYVERRENYNIDVKNMSDDELERIAEG